MLIQQSDSLPLTPEYCVTSHTEQLGLIYSTGLGDVQSAKQSFSVDAGVISTCKFRDIVSETIAMGTDNPFGYVSDLRARNLAMESMKSGYAQQLLLKLQTMMFKEQFCDVEIIVQGQHILCHRVVLASASDYFENMFRWVLHII